MSKNTQFIIAIITTFITALATSFLLEIPIFKHWLRQLIVVLFILVQLYLGFSVSKFIKEK